MPAAPRPRRALTASGAIVPGVVSSPAKRGVMLDLVFLGLGLAALALFLAYAAALRGL
jgi:hypothetical protein